MLYLFFWGGSGVATLGAATAELASTAAMFKGSLGVYVANATAAVAGTSWMPWAAGAAGLGLGALVLTYKGYQWKNQRGIAIDYLKNNPELARRIRSRSRSQSRRKSRRRSS